MSRPFYSDAKTAKNVSFSPSSFSSSHFLFPRDFSGTIADTNIITTPPEPFRPTDVLFVRYKSESIDLGGVFWLQNLAPSSESKRISVGL